MIADDLFAGAGGWDLAAAQLGIHARGVELMPEARATREAAGLTTIHDDVWTFAPDGNAAGLIASPPCQSFSMAGRGAGRKALDDVLRGIRDNYVGDLEHLRFLGEEVGDDRTALVLTPLHFALTGGYEWLAWEQVPTVLPVWEACAEALRARGWNVWTGIVHSEQYGVPQTRKRAKLLASRDKIAAPVPTHSRYYPHAPEKLDEGVPRWVSMSDALPEFRGATVVSNYGTGGDASARGRRSGDQPSATVTSKIDRNKVEWQARNSGPGAARKPRPIDAPSYTIRAQGSGSHPSGVEWVLRGSNQANAALRSIDQPAPTMLFGHCSNDVRWYPTGTTRRGEPEAAGGRHPDSRRVTVTEAGILQTFPADHPWQGGVSMQYLQIGNAVPPGLALHTLAAAAGIDASEVAA